MSGPLRVLAGGGLLVVGLLTGASAVLLHARWWGLGLAVAGVSALLVALPRGWWTRLPVAAGWGVAVVLGAVPRGEGDFLVAGDVAGYTLLVVSAVLLLAGFLGASS